MNILQPLKKMLSGILDPMRMLSGILDPMRMLSGILDPMNVFHYDAIDNLTNISAKSY